MDKYEYKVRTDEMKQLIREGRFAEAMEIADSIDWRRVKNTKMLCIVSDIYKINHKFEESKEILLLAYEKNPVSRLIVYSLCELCIKMDEVVEANEYLKEFSRLAPKDNGRYILRYKMLEAQDVSLEERISVLEEYKNREPLSEKWAYELAYLYHRVGLVTKCIEECDQLFLWFREGKYVLKALELKQIHTPLSAEQQYVYDQQFYNTHRTHIPKTAYDGYDENCEKTKEESIEVPPMDVGQYNTINLQKELAESMKEILPTENVEVNSKTQEILFSDTDAEEPPVFEEPFMYEEPFDLTREPKTAEMPIQEISLQDAQNDADLSEEEALAMAALEATLADESGMMQADKTEEPKAEEETEPEEDLSAQETKIYKPVTDEMLMKAAGDNFKPKMQELKENMTAKLPVEMARMLSQEYDGQISLVVPETEQVEKQITGQLNIIDVMAEWEKIKKDQEEKRAREVRQHVLEHTGNILAEFDEASRKSGLLAGVELDGLLEDEKEPESEEITETEEIEFEVSEDFTETEGEEEIFDGLDNNPEEVFEGDTSEDVSEEVSEEETFEEEEVSEEKPLEEHLGNDRAFSSEEKMLFHSYVQTKAERKKLIAAIDGMSLAAYTGNVIITGEESADTITLAKAMIKDMQSSDANFSGKVAKISGTGLDNKDVKEVLGKLENGALIIEGAHKMSKETVDRLYKALERENKGIIVFMEGPKKDMNKLVDKHNILNKVFTARYDIEGLSNKALVEYAKRYAYKQEYAMDELAILALHSRIDEMQTNKHSVTVDEVKKIVDDAIANANKKNLKHFFDVLCSNRYDEEDMIILREKDFEIE